MFAAKNQLLTLPSRISPSPVFDAVGGGGVEASSSAAVTFSHTATGPVLCYVLLANTAANSAATASYGGTSMSLLGSVYTIGTGSGFTYYLMAFYLMAPTSGAQTVTVTPPTTSYMRANTVSYTNVSSFGTPTTATGAGTALAQTVSSETGAVVSQVFTNKGTGGTIGSYNQNSRSNPTGGAWAQPLLIGDAAGAGSVSFTATGSLSATWAGMAVNVF